jgi:hypothetical protein
MEPPLRRRRGRSMQTLRLLHRSFGTSISALSRRPGHYGLCASLITALYSVTFIQGIQRFPVNAGLCSRLCLNLCNYSETAVSQLNGRRPDRCLASKLLLALLASTVILGSYLTGLMALLYCVTALEAFRYRSRPDRR